MDRHRRALSCWSGGLALPKFVRHSREYLPVGNLSAVGLGYGPLINWVAHSFGPAAAARI
jgi:hypothetical protein